MYIVNDEVELEKCNFEADPENAGKLKFDSIEYNYNMTPLRPKKGILVGSDYQEWFLKQAGVQLGEQDGVKKVSCARVTVLTYQPLCEDLSVGVATFVYPPGTFNVRDNLTNRHPIRVFQLNSSMMACPRNMFLIMAIMQLDCDVSEEEAREPFYAFIEKNFPNLTKHTNDPETGSAFQKSAIEIYPEK